MKLQPEAAHADVLVIGGGPAGLSAAIALRQRGADVLVAEAMHPPIDKACGEGLMPDSRVELSRLGIDLCQKDGGEFQGIRFVNRNGGREDCVSAQLANGIGLGVHRAHLHQLMVDRAESIGVRLVWGTHVDLKQHGEVSLNGDNCSFGHLIGADGQGSAIRRWAGLDRHALVSTRFGFRQHFRVRLWSRFVEVHWGAKGQAYVTPVGPEEICLATISASPQSRMEQVLESIPFLKDALHGLEITSGVRGAVTTTRRLQCVARDRVALIGDASGSADAITGEGLAMVFRQAQSLSRAIERDDLSIYAREHPGILRMPMTMARIMLMMDRWPLLRNRIMRVLAEDPALFSRMLGVHMGEESLPRFVREKGLHLGWRLLAPAITGI
jgi:menaquinone-9 beta-reductase